MVLVTPHSPYSPIYRRLPYPPYTLIPLLPLCPLIPLGPAYVAASLEEAAFNVRIVDLTFMDRLQFNVDEVTRAVLKLEPDVVGISSYTSTIPSAYSLANALKKERRDLTLVVGGAHTSALPQRTLEECQSLDAVIIGEGEHTFPRFLDILFDKGVCGEMAEVKGVMFRHKNRVLGDPNPVYIEDLNSLPLPARHLFRIDKYIEYSNQLDSKKHPVGSIITSRGCPYSCVYCSRTNNGRRYRARSPENVVGELEKLKEYGFNEVQVVDDNFTFDRPRVMAICKLIKERGLEMSFSLPNGVRVDSVDEELLSTMYDAGFYSISYGLESADDEVLKTIRKGTTVKQGWKAVRAAKKIGYRVGLFAIMGLPGSSVNSEDKTLQFIQSSEADSSQVSLCTPYPGSALWEMLEPGLKEVSWDRYNEGDVSNPIYVPEGWTRDQLTSWIDKMKKLSEGSE